MADDPWSHPLRELKKIEQEGLDDVASEQVRQMVAAEYESLWAQAIRAERTAHDLCSLGEKLKERGHRFWLDAWLLILRRSHEAAKRTRFREDDLLCAQAIRLLTQSMERDGESMDLLLRETYEIAGPTALIGPLGKAKFHIALWSDPTEYPHTPHMSRQELVAATRGMAGMSEPSICRKLKKSVIRTDEQKGHMARFKHVKPPIHLEMLRSTVEFLKNY